MHQQPATMHDPFTQPGHPGLWLRGWRTCRRSWLDLTLHVGVSHPVSALHRDRPCPLQPGHADRASA